MDKKGYKKHETKKKFMLDGEMVNFVYQGMVHGEKSKQARKKGIARNNHFGRFEQEGSSFHVFIRKKKGSSLFKSFYSGSSVTKSELLQVDKMMGKMDSEDREYLMDELPKSKNPRKKPFVHMSDLGYDVLNMSKYDFKKAEEKMDDDY